MTPRFLTDEQERLVREHKRRFADRLLAMGDPRSTLYCGDLRKAPQLAPGRAKALRRTRAAG